MITISQAQSPHLSALVALDARIMGNDQRRDLLSAAIS